MSSPTLRAQRSGASPARDRGDTRVAEGATRRTAASSDASFWNSLQDGSDDEDAKPSSSRPQSPPLPSGPSSRSHSVGLGVKDEGPSKRGGGSSKRDKGGVMPPLIDQLPVAWDEAHETFEVLERCVYETKKLGLSREQDEMMVCDCMFDKRKSRPLSADALTWIAQTTALIQERPLFQMDMSDGQEADASRTSRC